MTLHEMVTDYGLAELCNLFGWQGGTLRQAKTEAKRRLASNGIVEDKRGQLVGLVITR